mmetsp:Transcript_33695/g.60983  ORF Transcript_33695/g.60983 Transcript_33695/m.60983 type:complete len:202 (-) Transcript_33695:45-650(-)
MHKCIEQDGQEHVSVEFKWENQSNHYVDGAVMKHMEKGHLAKRHTHDEEPGVEKLPELLSIEYPEHVCQKRCMIIVIFSWNHSLIANKFAFNRCGRIHNAPNDISGQHDASKVVKQEDAPEGLALERLPSMLHVLVQCQSEEEVEGVRTKEELAGGVREIRLLTFGHTCLPDQKLLCVGLLQCLPSQGYVMLPNEHPGDAE